MSLYLYDGSIEGLLTAYDLALERGKPSAEFAPETGPQAAWLFEVERVQTDEARADRLLASFRQQGAAVHHLFRVLMAEQAEALTPLFEYLRLVKDLGPEADHYHAHPAVKKVLGLSRKVGGEIQRLKGLVRFRQLPGGLFWAPIEPDYHITYALAQYFTRRLADQDWILHDQRRQFAAVWKQRQLRYGPAPEISTSTPPSGGQDWERLWQAYFTTIAIPERRNPRLQRQLMPMRYWKYLIEKPQGFS